MAGSGFESGRYITKWLLIGGAIGAVAGVGAIVFYLATEWATQFFLGTLVGTCRLRRPAKAAPPSCRLAGRGFCRWSRRWVA